MSRYIDTKTGLMQKTMKHMGKDVVTTDIRLIEGLPVSSILGLFGPRASGKTILSIQLGFDVMSQLDDGGNVMYIDTEGNYHAFVSWIDRFSKVYGIDCDMISGSYNKDDGVEFEDDDSESDSCKFYVVDIRDIENLLSFVGTGLSLDVQKSKIDVTPDPDTWVSRFEDSELGILLADKGICYMVLDSISNPLKKFPTQQQNFPARATTGYNILLQLQQAAKIYSMPVVCITHQSNNPTRTWERPNFAGGMAIGYNFKFNLFMSRKRTQRTTKTLKRSSNVAEVWIERAPDKPAWDESGYVEIELTEDGFMEHKRKG